ncbi:MULTISPECIES: ketopantoate reductase family protein [unclassified Marinobacterium]|uniref:ketopantoate reductase family protein n=1 Tax=unclassified Marinobacterium TaxID=2644139 RepID=UPI00156A2AAA|nr:MULTISPECIES: 2-dehydropantoate 2-reductase [unclassified Marinobacterium]NRP57365.1 2-dehydropantoate 2-reductase [Marinobacterium sp. xm-d-510]NRP97877.1 2-dehydropantoate 2-reductase [Marinobacterium sp. xm-a-127]
MNDVMILGAGALGAYVGGCIAEAGYSVQLVNRSSSNAEVVNAQGLKVETSDDTFVVHPSAVQLEHACDARFVLLFTKTYQSVEAIKAIEPKLSPSSIIVTLQNGLGNGLRIAEHVKQSVIHGVTMIPATQVEPGFVRSHGFSDTWFGPLNPNDQHALSAAIELEKILTEAGITAANVDQPLNKIWQKACFNVAMNGVCALTDAGPGIVNDTEALKREAHALADEAVSVANAMDATVDTEALHNLINFACAEHRFHQPSMLQDVRAGRLTEVDSLNGFVVEQAKRLGVSVPKNELMTALILARQISSEFWSGVK